MTNATTNQMKKAKYSPEMEAALRAGYNPAADEATRKAQVEALSLAFGGKAKGFSTRSIIAKLSTMRDKNGKALYVPYEAKAPTTKKGPQRSELRRNLESVLQLGRDSLASFDRANKGELESLVSAIVKMAPESKDAEAS